LGCGLHETLEQILEFERDIFILCDVKGYKDHVAPTTMHA
jgi:hypothetical protein